MGYNIAMLRPEAISKSPLAKAFQGASRYVPAEIPQLEKRRDGDALNALKVIQKINESASGGTVYVSTKYQERQAEIAREVELAKEVSTLEKMGRSVLEIADHIRGRRINPHGFTMQDRHLLKVKAR